jgi:glycosyltransferase involved in cell wall biosynthesis
LAIVANVVTPYRLHLHERIATEIEDVQLTSIFTHERSDIEWNTSVVPEIIGAVNVADRGDNAQDPPWGAPLRNHQKSMRVIEALRRASPDAVILHGYNGIVPLHTMLYCRRTGVPFFLRGDSNIQNEATISRTRAIIKRGILSRYIGWSSGVMAFGSMGREYFARYGANPDDIYIVPAISDFDFWGTPPPTKELTHFCKQHSIDSSRNRLLFAGRFVHLKRIDILIDAFGKVLDQLPEWDIVLAGDGPMRGDLERRAESVGANRFRWLGPCTPIELRNAYYSSNVLVLPSEYEAWGLVVGEALASGLPAIASTAVGCAYDFSAINSDVVTFFDRNDSDSLSRAILRHARQSGSISEAARDTLASWRRAADPVRGIRLALSTI